MSVMYAVKEGISGFRRAKLAATGSIFTVTISLLLLGLFYVVSTNTSRIVERIREKVELEVFLGEPISRVRINELQQQLATMEGVDHVQFISKEEAAKIFKQDFGDDITKVLDFNPLPPSFRVFLEPAFRNTERADEIQKRIKKYSGVDDVVYRRDLLEFLDKRARTLYALGLALGIIVGISAMFLISNTIRLTIYAKRKAVQAMKLVGASRWYLRAPFLVEGVIQGAIGGTFASLIIYYMLNFAAGLLSEELAEFLQIDISFYFIVVMIGALLGLLGSIISVRKFIGESVVN